MFWEQIVSKVHGAAIELGLAQGNRIFYRGQSNDAWGLTPSLGRYPEPTSIALPFYDKKGCIVSHKQLTENTLYYQLFNRGGHLLPKRPTTWEILFLMQHHGFPTRLLDWTTSFATALYFALQSEQQSDEAAAIWILSPGKLNYQIRGDQGDAICFLDSDYPIGYEQYFALVDSDHYGRFPHPVVATWADSSNERLRVQRGAFTLHSDLNMQLEKAFASCVRKVSIPREAFPKAHDFLYLAGIDTASMFPDLTSLASFLVKNIRGR